MRLTRTQQVRGEVSNPPGWHYPGRAASKPTPSPPYLIWPSREVVKSRSIRRSLYPPQAGGVIATGQRSHTLGIPLGSGHHVWSDPLVAW
jgi:hypothetical protein